MGDQKNVRGNIVVRINFRDNPLQRNSGFSYVGFTYKLTRADLKLLKFH
jgi:hypothetical protein